MKVGFVGWRGMVGSVLLQRMIEELDFNDIPDRIFFSTSNVGGKGPLIAGEEPLKDANSVSELKKCDIIVTCQGSEWTLKIHPQLRKAGWKGYWLDTSSALRMNEECIIVLDPVNRIQIESGIEKGIRNFSGGNCTTSLLLMAIHGLFKNCLVEWVISNTYQAASGAGAAHVQELAKQMNYIGGVYSKNDSALELDKAINNRIHSHIFPINNFGVPLASNLIPWIDNPVNNGQTKEEWKFFAETNKILGMLNPIPIDGTCVRVGTIRCHSQALLIKLRDNISLDRITDIIAEANEWVKIIPNEKEATINQLTPVAISGTLTIAVGRLHKALIGERYLQAFTVGDQLLWGAAEPIRRTLRIILKKL